MIHIGTPYITDDEQYSYLCAPVLVSSDTADLYRRNEPALPKAHWRFYENYPPKEWGDGAGELYFAVPKRYKAFLCDNRSDAFIVAMLWYAIMSHSDIEFEAPVLESIYFGIRQQLIPALCKNMPYINLSGPYTDEVVKSHGAVGTGMSCGIDSLFTLRKYTDEEVPANYRLTHLTYFNMGAIFHPNTAVNQKYNLSDFYALTDQMSLEKLDNAKAVAELHNLDIVYVFSNLDKDYYRGGYGYTGVYRNCAMALALRGLFSVYYCSSAGWPEYLDLDLKEGSEHYETLLCDAFSTESLRFIISDYATRLEKTYMLASDETAQQYLDVCFNFNNCGTCSKCYRTLLTLDVLGAVNSFTKVFDVSKYMKNREKAFAWMLETMQGDKKDDNAVFARDLYAYITKNKIGIPLKARRICFEQKIKKGVIKILRPVKRRIKRIAKSLIVKKD